MKLSLNSTQRLNLHALIGAQRASVADTRMWWKVQDRIDLSEEERERIGYRVQRINGIDQVGWDASKQLPEKEYEFSSDEFEKLSQAVKDWQPGYLIQADRQWLEPLLIQMEGGASLNGAGSS